MVVKGVEEREKDKESALGERHKEKHSEAKKKISIEKTTHSVMTRWKVEPLKWRGLPLLPMPFSPVLLLLL